MKFGLISDLHLDFSEAPESMYDWRGDVLLIAGDTSEDKFRTRYLESVYDKFSKMAPVVVEVSGNHDYYSSYLDQADENTKSFLEQWPNIHFLQDSALTHLPVDIFGSTFWTDFGEDPLAIMTANQVMNDYRQIRSKKLGYRRIQPLDTLKICRQSKKSLLEFLGSREKSKPLVVVTHHAPSILSVHPNYAHEKYLNLAYYSDQSNLILDHPEIKFWCHGHTHYYFDYELGETRVLCNPRGYPNERPESLPPYSVKEFEV